MKKNNKKGFTIVELVIVIAVIAILAAVLIPTFSGVVARANESAALQEAKNQYTAYLAETAPENAKEGYVQVTKGNNQYYFTFSEGGLVTATAKPTESSENNDGFYTKKTTVEGETTTVTYEKYTFNN